VYTMRLKILLPFIALAFAALDAFALDTSLSWKVGNDIVLFDERVTATGGGFTAELRTSVGEFDGLVMDSRRSTLKWQRRVDSEQTDISAERSGSKVVVRGTYKGKPYERTHDIGDLPWYQLHEISYEELYASGVQSASFWTVDRKTMRPTEFKCVRLDEGTISIMGKAVPAVRYSLAVHGVPAFLFTSYFWLRKTDGRFLKLEVPAILGLPRSSVELTGES